MGLHELIELAFSQQIGAEPCAKREERQRYRNDFRKRDLITRVGRIALRAPRDREGRFSTQLFEYYQCSEKALELALQESYLQGVSTRKMRRITEKLCGFEFRKDQVSRMAQTLDEELDPWRNLSIEQPYLYLDIETRYEYVRENGHVESDGVLIVKGVNTQDTVRSSAKTWLVVNKKPPGERYLQICEQTKFAGAKTRTWS